MTTYTLDSERGERTVTGSLSDAMRAAIAFEAEWRTETGVTISGGPGYSFACCDGRIGVATLDGECGTARLVGDELVIEWDDGRRTFVDGLELQGS